MIVLYGLHVPIAVLISFATATLIPGASALLTQQHWGRGAMSVATAVLALASGFLSQLAAHPDDYSSYRALGAALIAFLIATASRGQWVDTTAEKRLHAVGSKRHPQPR